jgi:multiple sugar transport system ATP-binding protein
MTMGDRVCVLKDGYLQQVGTPRELYDRPDNVFVAGFIGSPAMNIIDLPLTQDGATIGNRTLPLSREVLAALQGEATATVGFRPESVRVVGQGEGFPFEVVVVEELGSDAYAYGNLHLGEAAGGGDKLLTLRVDAKRVPMKGEEIYIDIAPDEVHVFSTESGRRVSGDVAVPTV